MFGKSFSSLKEDSIKANETLSLLYKSEMSYYNGMSTLSPNNHLPITLFYSKIIEKSNKLDYEIVAFNKVVYISVYDRVVYTIIR